MLLWDQGMFDGTWLNSPSVLWCNKIVLIKYETHQSNTHAGVPPTFLHLWWQWCCIMVEHTLGITTCRNQIFTIVKLYKVLLDGLIKLLLTLVINYYTNFGTIFGYATCIAGGNAFVCYRIKHMLILLWM